MATSSLVMEITANTAKAAAGIESVSKSLEKLSNQSNTVKSKFDRLTAAFNQYSISLDYFSRGIKKAVAIGKDLINVYSVQEQAEVRLATTLKATNNVIGMSAVELYEMASAFQEVTTFGDEAIIEVEKLFVSSGKISKDAMPEAIEATLDMAAAMGEDLTGAAKRLAKALADPKSNLDALKDANIQLSEEQKNEIKQLQEANKLYEAQSVVLSAVKNSYGGIAKSLADTDTGKLTQIKNVWGDIKEGLGKTLLDTISPALDTLYESLKRISDWVYNFNTKQEIYSTYKEGGTYDFTPMNDDMLQSTYKDFSKDELKAQGPVKTANRKALDDIIAEMERRNIDYEGRRYISQNLQDQERADKEAIASNSYYKWKTEAERSGISTDDEWRVKGINAGMFSESDISKYEERQSHLDSIAFIEGLNRETAQKQREKELEAKAQVTSQLEVSSDSGTQIEEPSGENNNELISISDYISKYKSQSVTAQIKELKESLLDIDDVYESASDSEKEMLDEIHESMLKQIEDLEKVKNGVSDTLSVTEKLQKASELLSTYGSAFATVFDSIGSYVSQIFQNQIDAVEKMLSESESRWDSYLEKLDEKQEQQKDSLEHLYDGGLISLEEYNNATKEMYDDKIKAEEAAAEEQEALKVKQNELSKKQFEADKANNIAQALINGAMAITNIWATNAANPIACGILTALSAASTSAQVATISAQQFTPMAAGGIVSSPTYALLGEGGAKEAVLPLTESNMERAGLTSGSDGVININISIGTSYSGEQLSADVFKGIERAQRTGLLPNWRYA